MEKLLLSLAEIGESIGFAERTVRNWTYIKSCRPPRWPDPAQVPGCRYRTAGIKRWVDGLPPLSRGEQDEDAAPAPVVSTRGRGRGRPRNTPATTTGGAK